MGPEAPLISRREGRAMINESAATGLNLALRADVAMPYFYFNNKKRKNRGSF